VILDLLAFEDDVTYIFGHGDALDAVAWLGNQFFAQFLQRSHVAFQLGFGGTVVFLLEFVGLEAAGPAIGIWHDSDK
jgi:hypothetical protein